MAVQLTRVIQRFIGLSTDTKPTGVPIGSEFFENNIRATYVADANIEDFGTYNKTDPSGVSRLSSDGAKIKLINGDRDQDYYRTKDFGVDYFGDFTHWVDVNVTALTNDVNSSMFFWGVAEVRDDFKDMGSTDAIFLGATQASTTTHYKICLYDIDSGLLDIKSPPSSNINVNTPSYVSISRNGTTMVVEIYSTAALRIAGGAGDVDTVTNTVINTTFRYVYGLGSYNNGGAGKDISGTVSNLIINEVGASFWSKI